MNRRIEHLIAGNYEPIVPELVVRPRHIHDTVSVDTAYLGEITIGTDEDMVIRGYLSTDNPRVDLSSETFRGAKTTVSLSVNVRGLKNGDTLKARLIVTSSVGEMTVPIELDIEDDAIVRMPSGLESLDEFTSLADNAPGEAYRLFTGRLFSNLLRREETSLQNLYRALSQNPVTPQRMEEFLIAAGKKDPVTVALSAGEDHFYHIKNDTQEEMRLIRNTWGYLHFKVEVQGGFLEITKKQITEQDFIGSICDLPYVIHADKLGNCRQSGRIILRSATQTLIYKVTASARGERRPSRETAFKKSCVRLMRFYYDFRMNRIDTKTWSRQTLTTITAVRDMGPCPVSITLYEAYVADLSGDKATAKRLVRSLESYDFSGETLEIKGFFLYLCHSLELLTPGGIDVVARLRDWYQRSQESMILLFILMQVDEDLRRSPAKRLKLMEEMDRKGCMSPLLYVEAISLLRWNDSLLKLNGFTRRVLAYAARYDLFTEALYRRVVALSENEKSFRPEMYRVLTSGYEKWPGNDALEAICRLIMKGDPVRPAYFRWYAEAVEANVRLTRLYEYYIETIPPAFRDRLPLPVRKYFLLSGSVSKRRMAFIYANIVRNRSRDEESYREYLPSMTDFTAKSLMEGAINEDYAVLYREFYPSTDEPLVAEALSHVGFTARLYCDDDRMRDVIVKHEELAAEESFKLYGGTAYIHLYTPHAAIVFQDEKGRRYAANVPYSLEMLSDPDELTQECLALHVLTTGTVLHGETACPALSPAEKVRAWKYIADSDIFNRDFRQEACRKLLGYYTAHPISRRAQELLRSVDDELFIQTDRIGYLEVLLSQNLDGKAWYILTRFGYERVNAGLMMPLVSRMAEETEAMDDSLLKAAWYVYTHEKYDDKILKYLLKYFTGSLEDCLSIRQSAAAFYLETYDFDERLLCQAMFIRRSLPGNGEILRDYRRQGGQSRIVMAMAAFESHQAFRDIAPLNDYTRFLLSEAFDKGWAMEGICHLALLKAYAKTNRLSENEEKQVDRILEDMHKDGIRLDFCRCLPKRCLAGYGLEDTVFVETFAGPKDKVMLYYALNNGPTQAADFVSEPMTEMCYGLYSREFILFYGEVLTYYITVERLGKVTRTPEKVVTMPHVDMTGQSRYQLINQMLSAEKTDKADVLREKIRVYNRLMQSASSLFKIMEESEVSDHE